ncbi:MAG: methyltransferase domain-containing protein [Candidatus Dormibacteraeota bacterium]|nr:methyltransferase domain-containing protein [Candidatus Dormibacteraeota bacterium]
MPADAQDPEVDVDALTDRLKEMVEERRRSGEYPQDLEWELDDHFRRITARAADMGDLQRLLEDVKLASEMGRHRIEYTSGVPMGTQLHKTIGRAVSRQTEGALNQVNDFARAVLVLLQAMVESRPVHETVLPDINARLDSVLERLAAYERVPEGADAHTRALAARIERLESSLLDIRSDRPYARRELQKKLRGSRDEVMARYKPLAERFAGLAPVLDIGSGGGEMLELLGQLDVEARGVDIDPEAIEEATAANLTVTRADGLAYLGSMADQSLGGIFLGHVLEEMAPEDAVALLELTRHKLRPGGRLVVAGYNPASVYFQATTWYGDPAHVRPMPSALIQWLLGQWGFADVSVKPLGPEPAGLEAVPAPSDEARPIADASNRNIDRLNQLLFAPLSEAVVATR